MSKPKGWYVLSGDRIRYQRSMGLEMESTEKELQKLMWKDMAHFVLTLDQWGYEQRPCKNTHHVSAAEQEAILAAKCQPAHVSGTVYVYGAGKLAQQANCPDEAMKARDLRPAFTSDQRTPFDNFPGFVCEDWQHADDPSLTDAAVGPQSPLQRLNDGSAICGSAHLLRG